MASRMLSTDFWNDEDVQELSAIEKSVYIYLMTAPGSNICGLYRITLRTISFHTGWILEEVTSAIESLSVRGKVTFDSGLVFVKNLAFHQKAETFGNFHSHCHKVNQELRSPQNAAYKEFTDKFSSYLEEFQRTGVRGFKKTSKKGSTKGSQNTKVKVNIKDNVNSSSLESAENLSLDENEFLTIWDSWKQTYVAERYPPYDQVQLKEWWIKYGTEKTSSAVERVKKRSGWKLRMVLQVLEGKTNPEEFPVNGKSNGQHKPTTSEQHAGGF